MNTLPDISKGCSKCGEEPGATQILGRVMLDQMKKEKAVSKWPKFNLNDYIWVQVTEYGKACYVEDYKKITGVTVSFTKEEINGWSKYQMHDLMATFGQRMYLGTRNVIEINISFVDPNI